MTTSKELNLTDTEYKTEEWLPIPGHPNHAVSDMGRVKRLTTVTNTVANRILKGTLSQSGYRLVLLDGKMCRFHRLVMLAFIGECPEGKEVNHKNGIKDDNRLCNLEYISKSANMFHSFVTGLHVSLKGKDHGRSKLTEADVYEIRSIGKTMTQQELSARYGVNRTTIYHILNRKTWKHLDGEI